jgi:hypothetical protein
MREAQRSYDVASARVYAYEHAVGCGRDPDVVTGDGERRGIGPDVDGCGHRVRARVDAAQASFGRSHCPNRSIPGSYGCRDSADRYRTNNAIRSWIDAYGHVPDRRAVDPPPARAGSKHRRRAEALSTKPGPRTRSVSRRPAHAQLELPLDKGSGT